MNRKDVVVGAVPLSRRGDMYVTSATVKTVVEIDWSPMFHETAK